MEFISSQVLYLAELSHEYKVNKLKKKMRLFCLIINFRLNLILFYFFLEFFFKVSLKHGEL
jgi:hypothetical protein